VGSPESPNPAGSSLLSDLRDGSRSAMDEIFRTHLDAIYNYCYRRSGSWSTAEDLTSAVFLEVWKTRRRAIELDGSVLPWLYGVATNVCRNHQRSQRRGQAALAKLHLADVSPEQVDRDVVEQLDADRRLARVLEQLRELPQTEQDVFVLVCWEDLSYAQTAQALNIPIGTVRSRLARVRRILRLTDDLESSDV
jgi:RNA polymerase sigma factor (sigma-70 family)